MKKGICYIPLVLVFFICIACGSSQKNNNSALTVLIDDWTHKFEPGAVFEVPVELVNRSNRKWKDSVFVYVKKDKEILKKIGEFAEIKKGDTLNLSLKLPLPQEEGDYEVVAEYLEKDGRPIRSRRLIEVDKPIVIDI